MKRKWNGKDSSSLKIRQEAFISQEGEVKVRIYVRRKCLNDRESIMRLAS